MDLLTPPFAAITAFTLLGKLSKRLWSLPVGMCAQLSKRAFVKSGIDFG